MNKTPRKYIAIYSREGRLIDVYTAISCIVGDFNNTTNGGVRAAIKTGHIYKDMFFKEYENQEEIPNTIFVHYLCKIDNLYFIKQIEVVNYLGVTRQLVSAAVKSRAKTIAGHKVEWID